MKLTSLHFSNKTKRSKGFSLIEVIIALGIVALLLTGFLGVFGSAQKNIQRSLSVKEANQLKDSLETEMAILRPGDKSDSGTDYTNHFEKVFDMVKNSDDPAKAVIIYQYKAQIEDTDSEPNDGILPAYKEANNVPGAGYITQVAVRRIGAQDTLIENELDPKSVDGAVYAVRITQLVSEPGSANLILGEPGKIEHIVGDSREEVQDAEDYNSAVITFQAEFYKLPTNDRDYVSSDKWDFQKMGNPAATINMAVRR